ncbi:MAG TPA: hypothetical protein VEI03_20590 [Stellaceae bacterium]|nr:hypothetical protein [Stellaceae bacterium]
MANAKAKKSAATKKAKKPYPHVDIDIPKVTAKTKVSSLTVGQLVELLVQVHTQLPIQRGMPSPKVVNDAIKQVHQLILSPDSAFRGMQMAVLKEIPNIRSKGPWAPKDGGPAPNAGDARKAPG